MSKRTRYLLGIGVIAALVLGWQIAAFAVHDEVFQLEGDAVDNATSPPDDWENVFEGTSGATDTAFVTEPSPNSSFFTGGGSKDPQDIPNWLWKDESGGLPDKANLQHSYAAAYTVGTAPNQRKLLYFGADRFDGSGDAAIGFWFFQNEVTLNGTGAGNFTGDHKNGDVLVISNFSNGGTVPTITVYKWDTTCGSKVNNPQPGQCGAQNLRVVATSTSADCANPNPDTACAIVNSAQDDPAAPWPFADKDGNTEFAPGEFMEGGIDLTALGLGASCFSTALAETRTSTSPTSTLKDFTLGAFGQCGSSVTTTPKDNAGNNIPGTGLSIGTGSVQVKDSATVNVTGATTWAGNLQFALCGPLQASATTCAANDSTKTAIGSAKAVSNTTPTVLSDAATVTSAGKYCWRADFTSTTSGVPNSSDASATECFTVNPVTPNLATTAGADVLLGNPVTDTAALSGTANQPGTPVINPTTAGAKAGGTITFTLLKNDCTTLATGTGTNPQTVNVDGNGTYPTSGSVSFTPDAVGTYHWKAVYTPANGDPNNLASTHNGNCSDSNETVVVTSVPSSMTTAQSFIPNDSATVSATQGGDLAGSVHFQAYESSDCSGTAIVDQTKTVSGASPQTVSTTNTTVSTTAANISWSVSYDSTNPAQDDIAATCKEATALTIDNDTTQP